jgi:putative chitinase
VAELAQPDAFYAHVRELTGALDHVQVEVIEQLLPAASAWPISWLAYGLATAWHEARLTPQAEWGKGAGHPYARLGKYGHAQYGRGLVQLTWDRNYEWADKRLELHGALLKNFDLALQPAIAVGVLVHGMEEGAFTGRGLAHYLPDPIGTLEQFEAARHIINGSDRAELIAGHAVRFQAAIIAGGWA